MVSAFSRLFERSSGFGRALRLLEQLSRLNSTENSATPEHFHLEEN